MATSICKGPISCSTIASTSTATTSTASGARETLTATRRQVVRQLQREHWPPKSGIVRQEITIDGTDRNELFYVSPYISLEETSTTITVDHALQRLQRSVQHPLQQFKYTLATTAIVGGEQLPLTPAAECELSKDTLDVPTPDLPQLVKLAKVDR